MDIKKRLTIMNFMEFFVWGAWLITIGAYWFQNKQWKGDDFGSIFSTMGVSAIFMPAVMGIIADRWINAERLLGLCHLIGAVILYFIPQVNDPGTFYWVLLLYMLFYMPTISLANTVSYTALVKRERNIVKDFPPIRVWGTIGFIAAMWTVSLLHIETSAKQFYVAAAVSFLLGIYSFTLPKCPPAERREANQSWIDIFGLRAFSLFKDYKMALFFIFAMLLGAALQLTNAYGDTFLHDFAKIDIYKDTIAVKYPAIIMSISQISETLFILAIPFFLRRFGIKQVMLISMFAWVLRFGLFAYSNPADGLWMIILSCIVYGMAFDFFNISGSLFVDTQVKPEIRASAQGIYMMMTNGFGAWLGSRLSGIAIAKYFTNSNNELNWQGIWTAFAIYSLLVALLFAILFRYKHKRPSDKEIELAEALEMTPR
ncbi:nucleoside permease [Chitinophagaceae bacterium LB-8]|uniref:Nucleoside permease n=1 Tax=Paraflavisolibacter caeni TaxID=2982496 RepID=A0A9X2XPQ7_9BACT|nr:nucleoside permease [Paraflavisolibacter caeni]MCU7551534.1 nucleoside permease [Paraflavisolibacter caeni]